MRGRTMKNAPLGRASRKNEKGSLSFGAGDIYFGGTFGYFIDSRIIVNKSRGAFRLGPFGAQLDARRKRLIQGWTL